MLLEATLFLLINKEKCIYGISVKVSSLAFVPLNRRVRFFGTFEEGPNEYDTCSSDRPSNA